MNVRQHIYTVCMYVCLYVYFKECRYQFDQDVCIDVCMYMIVLISKLTKKMYVRMNMTVSISKLTSKYECMYANVYDMHVGIVCMYVCMVCTSSPGHDRGVGSVRQEGQTMLAPTSDLCALEWVLHAHYIHHGVQRTVQVSALRYAAVSVEGLYR